jgi:hypothetical protein
MCIQVFHSSDDVDCSTKKKQTQNSSPLLVDTSRTLPTATLIVRLSHKYTPQLSVFKFQLQIRKTFMWTFRFPRSTAMTHVTIQTWRLIIVLVPSILGFGTRIEVCVTWNKVLSNDWTIFIIQISNAFFNT